MKSKSTVVDKNIFNACWLCFLIERIFPETHTDLFRLRAWAQGQRSEVRCAQTYPAWRAWGLSCAPSWAHRRSTSRSTAQGSWPGAGSGTTPWVAGTHCTDPGSRWRHSRRGTGICSWVESSGHCGKLHRCTHNQCQLDLRRREEEHTHAGTDNTYLNIIFNFNLICLCYTANIDHSLRLWYKACQ